ncbi:MAG TPA: HlyD family efflux transporter periplasmic adaptor subunit [Pseudonocardia sp.]|uniref:HlyD family efflux transporter periplasmic adaptor subunit n=1 Tax=Pseudonocardia sp. TaxID=60912 RepID=UPI002B6AE19C|nr:HlyD family efflux transporter periplasmic adaptor subunit [Pseudonocardia sp.]HTF51220.1 HlyD family efflux transporter periplasmic adaptor subunit [Pseudonocardia sp.]
MGFSKAAQLLELDVKVGDIVRPGQVLARQDPFSFQQILNQYQAQLNNQRAILDRIVNGTIVHGDSRTLDQAKKILDATRENRDATVDRDQNAVDQAERTLDFQRRQLRQARIACQTAVAPTVASGLTSTLTGSGSTSSSSGSSSSSSSSASSDDTTPSTCNGNTTAQTNLNTAISSFITARNSLETAEHTLEVDRKTQDVNVETTRQNVVTAQNAYDSDRSDRGPNIDAQAALVANAAAFLAGAQRDVNNTTLYAPLGGTVSAINGAVGEWLGAGGGTTALAPGTDAGIPGVGAAATSDQSSASSALSATRPGGSAFIVLNNIDTYQVVVPFEESDAARVAPNQKVRVTFDAIPDLERDGTVLSVAPGGVNISGVTNYYATILLTNSDPRLRSGLTAETGVLVNSLDNVLVVPNSAIIRQGGRTFVNTPGPDGRPVQTQFQPGLVGDDNTQVLSGLREGQEIQLPQASVSGAPGGR